MKKLKAKDEKLYLKNLLKIENDLADGVISINQFSSRVKEQKEAFNIEK